MKSKEFRLRVKQHTATLNFITDIQDIMRVRDISCQDLAKQLNRSCSWVYRTLHNPSGLTFFKAVEIADAFDMNIELKFK